MDSLSLIASFSKSLESSEAGEMGMEIGPSSPEWSSSSESLGGAEGGREAGRGYLKPYTREDILTSKEITNDQSK